MLVTVRIGMTILQQAAAPRPAGALPVAVHSDPDEAGAAAETALLATL
jgi:hypothetical protein